MRRLPLFLLTTTLAFPSVARAAPVWVGDMEPGDLSQWNNVLNGEINGMTYAQVSADQTIEGQWAARIELHNDAVWPNGLKRVEINHTPEPGRTAEGATLYFAWSFFLEQTLPVDPSQQIAYWESNMSYQQMMAFEITGERITFSTRQPNNVIHWDQDGLVTAGEWHRIATRITWSKDPAIGSVDVWFDGQQVVTDAKAKTLNDDNAHFTQLGLLRGQVEFADVPVIYIDDAVEGDNLEDVRPDLPVPDPGTTTGDETTTTPDATTTAPDATTGETPDDTTSSSADETTTTVYPPGPTTGDDPTIPVGTTGEATGTQPMDDDSAGCGCTGAAPGAPGLLVLLALQRRRRPR